MTSLSLATDIASKHDADIIGPYSPWPRGNRWRLARPAVYAGGTGPIGIFVHSAIPLIACGHHHSTEGAPS